MVVSGGKLDDDVGLSRLHFVELERRHITPDTERFEDRTTRLVVTQIRCEVENPGRNNVTQFRFKTVIFSLDTFSKIEITRGSYILHRKQNNAPPPLVNQIS